MSQRTTRTRNQNPSNVIADVPAVAADEPEKDEIEPGRHGNPAPRESREKAARIANLGKIASPGRIASLAKAATAAIVNRAWKVSTGS